MGDRGDLLSQIQAGKRLKSVGTPPAPASPGRVLGGPTGPPSRGGPSRATSPSKPSSPLPALPGPSTPSRGPSKPLPSLPMVPTKPLPPSPMAPPSGPPSRPPSRSVSTEDDHHTQSRGPPFRPPPRGQGENDPPPMMRPPGRPTVSVDDGFSPRGPPSRPPGRAPSEDDGGSPHAPMRLPGMPSSPKPFQPDAQQSMSKPTPLTVVPAALGKEFEERLKYNFPAAEMQVEAGLYVIRRFASYISKLCKAMQIYYGSVDEISKKEVGLGAEFQKDGMTDHVTTILAFESIMTENSRRMHNFATSIFVDVVGPLQACHTNSVAQLKSISEQFQNLYKPFAPLQRQQRRCVEVSVEMESAKTDALKSQLKVKLDAEAAKYDSMKSSMQTQASGFHSSTQPLLASLQQIEQSRLYVLQQALNKLSEQCNAMEHLGGVNSFRETVAQLSEAKALDAWTSGITKSLDQNFVSQSNPSGPPVADWPLTDNTYRLTHRATISAAAGASMRHLWGSVKSGVVDAVESVKSSKGGDASSVPSAPTPEAPAMDAPLSPRGGIGRPPSAPAAPEPPSSPPLSPGPPSSPPFRGSSGPPMRMAGPPSGPPMRAGGPSAPPRKPAAPIVVGQYDYPGTGDESYDLLFSEGDRIELLTPPSVDWDAVAGGEVIWCTGRLVSSGAEGGFPASFVALE